MSAASPIVTLTTDFGDGSSYVAAMKGAILSVNSEARIVDLCHSMPPQDLIAAARFLPDVLPYLPPESIHVVVVDPGVGTSRDLLCVRWNQQMVLVPDNGCWTSLEPLTENPLQVIRLTRREYWRRTVSATFHGRDILAPVAGHLSLGVQPAELGEPVTAWQRIVLPEPHIDGPTIRGEVVQIDRFGNLLTNLPAEVLGSPVRIRIANSTITRIVTTYADAEPGCLIALASSSGKLEIAVVNGSAGGRLGVGLGADVVVTGTA